MMDHALMTPAGMTRVAFSAMGTGVEVLVPSRDAGLAHRARTLFQDWEGRLSRFRGDSELTRLNDAGGGVVSPLLARVLGAALRAAHHTDGLFDPTLGRHLARCGYDRPFTEMDPSLPTPRPAPGPGGAWRRVLLTDRRLVRLPEGARLDLGGVAKGMAVDAAARMLRDAGVPGGVVSAGGDLTVWGLPPRHGAWSVQVDTDAPEGTVRLLRGSMATSSTAKRRWGGPGAPLHHAIDPRTGTPADTDLVSVSVVAARCEDAEVAATACLVLGSAGAARFLAQRDLSGLLVGEDGTANAVGAWPSRTAREVSR